MGCMLAFFYSSPHAAAELGQMLFRNRQQLNVCTPMTCSYSSDAISERCAEPPTPLYRLWQVNI
jgi:hypothetical protein